MLTDACVSESTTYRTQTLRGREQGGALFSLVYDPRGESANRHWDVLFFWRSLDKG